MNIHKNRFAIYQSHLLELNFSRSRNGYLNIVPNINPYLVLLTRMRKIQLILFRLGQSLCIITF